MGSCEAVPVVPGQSSEGSQTGERSTDGIRSIARLCGLTIWTTRAFRENWFVGSLGLAMCFWLVLWWIGSRDIAAKWGGSSLVLYLSLSLWQPALEELGFRGLLQGVLLEHQSYRSRIGPLTLANVVTSVAFGIAHLPSHPAWWVAGILLTSLLLGYARDRTGSLYPSIVLHGYFNAGYFLVVGIPS